VIADAVKSNDDSVHSIVDGDGSSPAAEEFRIQQQRDDSL